MTAAGEWFDVLKAKPPLHNQVLVRLAHGCGFVADVACYAGKFQRPEGGAEDRWILADVRLETNQITHWAELHDVEAPASPGIYEERKAG